MFSLLFPGGRTIPQSRGGVLSRRSFWIEGGTWDEFDGGDAINGPWEGGEGVEGCH